MSHFSDRGRCRNVLCDRPAATVVLVLGGDERADGLCDFHRAALAASQTPNPPRKS